MDYKKPFIIRCNKIDYNREETRSKLKSKKERKNKNKKTRQHTEHSVASRQAYVSGRASSGTDTSCPDTAIMWCTYMMPSPYTFGAFWVPRCAGVRLAHWRATRKSIKVKAITSLFEKGKGKKWGGGYGRDEKSGMGGRKWLNG